MRTSMSLSHADNGDDAAIPPPFPQLFKNAYTSLFFQRPITSICVRENRYLKKNHVGDHVGRNMVTAVLQVSGVAGWWRSFPNGLLKVGCV